MATTNATISINSDISSYPVRINSSMTMKKAGTCHGLEETNGLRHKKFTGTSAAIIIEAAEYTADKAHKVYIRNASSNKEYFFYVAYNASAAAAATAETIGITVASSTTETQTLEYMVFADVLVDQTS